MSRESVEIVRRIFAGWVVGDFSEGDAFDPDVEFDMVDWPEAGRSRGRAEMWATWQGALGAWEDFRAEPREFIEIGEQVVVLVHVRARGKGSGIDVSADTGTLWRIDGGRIVHLSLYWDSAKAFEAAQQRA